MPSCFLTLEVGSTITKANAFTLEDGGFVHRAQGFAPTSVAAGDVRLGVQEAIADLEAHFGPLPPARETFVNSSAAGGLRMTVHGLTYSMTARAAREAALGAGAIVKLVTAGALSPYDLDDIRAIRPNIVLLAGGVDYGEKTIVLQNAEKLAGLRLSAPVIYAGNIAIRKHIQQIFAGAGMELLLADNVFPEVDVLNVEPLRRVIHEVFNRHIIHGPGMGHIAELTRWGILPTPGAVLRGGVLALAVRPTGGQTDPRLESLAARLNTLLAAPLQFEAFDPITGEFLRWQAPVEQAAGWLRPDLSGAAYSILVDRDALAAYLAEYSAGLGPERKLVDDALPEDLLAFWEYGQALELEVYHNPTRLVVQAGDTYLDIAARVGIPYWRIQNANPGVTLRGGLEITIPSKNDLLPLPVVRDKRIVISISDQHLWAYENGELRSESVISTGMASSPTMAGVFQVQSHIKNAYGENWDLWMPDFMGIYEAVPGFWNGIHGLPLLHNGVRLWGNVLGRPASYGCIILTLAEGEDLYNWAEDGVVVEIRR